MLPSTLRRAATVGGALLAIGATVATAGVSADAAVPGKPKFGQAQGLDISVAGLPLQSTEVYAQWRKRGDATVVKTAPNEDVPGDQSLVTVGVSAAKAAAANGISYGCGGVIAKGGSLDVGNGSSCRGRNPGAGGVGINLGTGATALPTGIGYIFLRANAVTATARYDNTAVSGGASIVGLRLDICLGLSVNGKCVARPISVPIKIKGGPNENVVTDVVDAIADVPALNAVLDGLSTFLSGAVVLTSNVQTTGADGSLSVTGLHVGVLGETVVTADLANATAGPLATA